MLAEGERLERRPMAHIEQTITIKQCGGARLYNTATASYVTLEDLAGMVEDDEDFIVYEANTGEDITRSVLKRIIVERAPHG
jgi:polyhydroxyalkanoate synthesis repressor PhaR